MGETSACNPLRLPRRISGRAMRKVLRILPLPLLLVAFAAPPVRAAGVALCVGELVEGGSAIWHDLRHSDGRGLNSSDLDVNARRAHRQWYEEEGAELGARQAPSCFTSYVRQRENGNLGGRYVVIEAAWTDYAGRPHRALALGLGDTESDAEADAVAGMARRNFEHWQPSNGHAVLSSGAYW